MSWSGLPKRIEDLLMPVPFCGCWIFVGKWQSRNDYGRVTYEGKETQIHIVTFKLLRGDYAPGLLLDHLCRVPPCANPWHLEPVTVKVNTDRGHGVLHQFRKRVA
jgi:hypothetical protein